MVVPYEGLHGCSVFSHNTMLPYYPIFFKFFFKDAIASFFNEQIYGNNRQLSKTSKYLLKC